MAGMAGLPIGTPDWWEELRTISNVSDPKKLAQKIWASFEIPGVRYETLRNHKEYSVPPVPKCVKLGVFLQGNLPYQDVQLKSLQSILAYAQALQYWAEKANLLVPCEPCLLAMSIHELRQQMRRYTTFRDHNVFEGLAHRLPEVEVEEATKANPIKPLIAEGPIVSTTVPLTSESAPITLGTSPAISEEDLVTLITTPAASVDEPANPHTPLKVASDTGSHLEQEYLKWVKVHSSHMAASVGRIPCSPGDLQLHCHNHSSGWQKRAWCLLEEE